MTEDLVELLPDGQVTLPASICSALDLKPGARFRVYVDAGRILLEPETMSPIDALYGKYAGDDLLTALEAEHRSECVDSS
jgi:AbrB family looped-hinge helix DNA binding protein